MIVYIVYIASISATIGTICFAASGFPQMVKSIREKHSNGIAHGTIWLWLFGEFNLLLSNIGFWIGDLMAFGVMLLFSVNYLANLIIVGIIAKYKYWPTNRLD